MLRKSFARSILVLFLSLIVLAFYGCSTVGVPNNEANNYKNEADKNSSLTVHFIDVGQADSILVKTPEGKVMLIDGGNNGDSDTVISYLKKQGVSKIDVLVGTHPHEDHIGGLDKVIENFDIGKFYMPKVSSTTKTYKDVINAAKSKGLVINTAKDGVSLDLGSEIDTEILSPISNDYDELNDYSAVIKLSYGKVSFLFTGDAGKIPENEMLKKGNDLSAWVLKVGHHGSDTSTTDKFLDAVSPKYAVISVGKDNDYNHPSSSTISKLKNRGIRIYRTDESGTIIASTDGREINFNK